MEADQEKVYQLELKHQIKIVHYLQLVHFSKEDFQLKPFLLTMKKIKKAWKEKRVKIIITCQ